MAARSGKTDVHSEKASMRNQPINPEMWIYAISIEGQRH